MKKLTKIFCCFNSLVTYLIEILIIILSTIGMILSIIGMVIIPWGYTAYSMKIIFLISLVLFIYSLIIPSFFLFLRKKKYNAKIIYISLGNIIILLFSCILSIFFYIIIAIWTIPDLKSKKTNENFEGNEDIEKLIKNGKKLVSNGKLTLSIFLIIINLILWIILLSLWASELVRIKYKIEGTYYDYINNQKILTTTISIESSQKNDLNLIGHNKFGFPIYINKRDNIKILKSKSDFNYKPFSKFDNKNINDTETNNILRYSYKEKLKESNIKIFEYKSVDQIQKLENEKKEKKEKYIENYTKGAVNPYYSNFENKTGLNVSNCNNSINPGY